jgi:molecular chaperone GrpE
VMDNLALGVASAKQPGADLKALAGGVEMVLAQLKSALASHGLKEISPLGQPFDANLHESISAQPSATVPEGNVVTVVRTGYSLNGRLLRPAAVIVSSGAAKKDGAKA